LKKIKENICKKPRQERHFEAILVFNSMGQEPIMGIANVLIAYRQILGTVGQIS